MYIFRSDTSIKISARNFSKKKYQNLHSGQVTRILNECVICLNYKFII